MISTVHSVQLNNKLIDVDLEKVPAFSDRSRELFIEHLSTYLPPSLHTAASLTGRVEKMEKTAKILAETKDHRVKNLLIACFKTTVVAALLAAVILGAIYGGEFAPVYVTLGWIAMYALSLGILLDLSGKGDSNATVGAAAIGLSLIIPLIEALTRSSRMEWGMDQQRTVIRESLTASKNLMIGGEAHAVAGAAAVGLGLFIPLGEALTRTSRIEADLKQQQKELEEAVVGFKKANETMLPQGYRFFKEHSSRLHEKIDEKIEETQQSLVVMRQLVGRSPNGEKELSDRIGAFRQAKDELSALVDFYRQFDPS